MNLYFRLLLLFLRGRHGAPLSIWDTARTPFRVVPTDLDVLGHMNNGKYLTLMDLGRMDLLIRSGMWREASRRGWYPVVACQTISYRRSLNPGQRFDLYTRLLGFHGNSGFLEQTFCVGETVYAQALVRARFLKKTGGKVEQSLIAEIVGPTPPDREIKEWMVQWNDATKPPTEFRPPAG